MSPTHHIEQACKDFSDVDYISKHGGAFKVIYRFLMLKFQFLEAISTAVDLGDAITSIKALFNSLGQKIKFRSWTSRTSRVLRTVTLE